MIVQRVARDREKKEGEKEGGNSIKTVNIQGVDRKTGTPHNILQSNTTAMQKPLEVLLFSLIKMVIVKHLLLLLLFFF